MARNNFIACMYTKFYANGMQVWLRPKNIINPESKITNQYKRNGQNGDKLTLQSVVHPENAAMKQKTNAGRKM